MIYILEVALSIKDEEADRLARELARQTGESLTQVVVVSLRERLARLEKSPEESSLVEDLLRIGKRNAARRVLDTRSVEDVLGYDESGLPQ